MPVEPEPASTRRTLSADAPPSASADVLRDVRHGFFGRRGGVSTGIYATLNAGTGSRDAPDATRENRRRIAAAFGAPVERLVGVHQVHSPDCVFVDAPWPGERPHADALVTTRPGLVISVLTADCAPVLFADARAGVIGAAHAGWRGAFSGVLERTVARMIERGADRHCIVAAIGPCIQQTSYEVGDDFHERFLAADPTHERYFVARPQPGKWSFDLPGFCASRLRTMNLGGVEVSSADTFASPDSLFSHRRSVRDGAGDYGRNCAAIALG